MAYTPHRIANEFLSLAEQDGRALTNMQLQKLIFLAHGYALALFGHPLSSQPVHAFDWGPVFPILYKALKKFGSGAVSEKLPISSQEQGELSGEDQSIVDAVWGAYGHQPGSKLSALTHQEGTPWSQIFSVSKYGIIPDEVIDSYYRGTVNAGEKTDNEASAT